MRPTGSPEELERRRRRSRAIGLLRDGFAPVEIAHRVGVDRRSVRRWSAAYRKNGMAALKARPAPGRPSVLDAKAKRQVERILLKGARAAGFHTDLWTCPRVAQVIEQRFGVRYHVDHIGRLLHGLGWSPQKPERRALERDKVAIRRWVCQQWPRVKKRRLPPCRDCLHRRSGLPDGAPGAPHLGAARSYASAPAAWPLAAQGQRDRCFGDLAPPPTGARLLRIPARRQLRWCLHPRFPPAIAPCLGRADGAGLGPAEGSYRRARRRLADPSSPPGACLPAAALRARTQPGRTDLGHSKSNLLANFAPSEFPDLVAQTQIAALAIGDDEPLLRSFIKHGVLPLHLT